MRVLFVALRHDYGDPARGDSFEFTNFWDTLRRMNGIDAELFPFDEEMAAGDRETMNKALLKKVKEWSPDLVFFFFFKNEIDERTVAEISDLTTTVNWFADDQWRYQTFSRFWAPHLRWVATTYPPAAESYRSLGATGVIETQWGCNHFLYRPVEVERDLDLSFIGQPHGDRRAIVQRLRKEGFSVNVWGYGWDSGRIGQEEMIKVFSRSKINLNLSNASSASGPRELAQLFVKRRGKLVVPRKDWRQNLQEFLAKRKDQIKGRNFEIPGCRTFLLTSAVEGLARFFEDGKEVVTFSTVDDLVDKARHYLQAPEIREKVAAAGYQRTLGDHTYETRFQSMFRQMGLMS